MSDITDPTIDPTDTIVIDAAPGARSRTVDELSQNIKKAGGSLTVFPNDSAFIVASNNGLRFSITRLANGQYRIVESQGYLLAIGVAIVVGVLILSRR